MKTTANCAKLRWKPTWPLIFWWLVSSLGWSHKHKPTLCARYMGSTGFDARPCQQSNFSSSSDWSVALQSIRVRKQSMRLRRDGVYKTVYFFEFYQKFERKKVVKFLPWHALQPRKSCKVIAADLLKIVLQFIKRCRAF